MSAKLSTPWTYGYPRYTQQMAILQIKYKQSGEQRSMKIDIYTKFYMLSSVVKAVDIYNEKGGLIPYNFILIFKGFLLRFDIAA